MQAWVQAAAMGTLRLLFVFLSLASAAYADVPSAPAGRSAWRAAAARANTPAYQQLLSQGAQLERASRWSDAYRLYQEGLSRWPQVPALRAGTQRCETHLDLARRYEDGSFRRSLTTLSRSQALALYGEVLGRMEGNYVDPINFERLVRHGTRNLQTALHDSVFLRHNAPAMPQAQVGAFGKELASLHQRPVSNRRDAIALVQYATDLAGRRLGMRAAAVVMEYVAGACAALDVHTGYLTADTLTDLYSQIDGSFVGVGVEVQADAEGLVVMGVVADSPASQHGLRVGDHITRVNGQSLRGLSTDVAAGRLKGPRGTYVKVTVRPVRGVAERSMVLPRREIEVKSISEARLLDPDRRIAYIRLNGFQKSTVSELDGALWRMHRQGMRALIFDLRGNPGGLLSSAVEVSDRFIDKGTIVSTRGRAAGQSWRYSAGRPGQTWRVPMVVLIDGNSASASEIVAACLADHGRAVLVGEKSYGKGEVQSIYPLATTRAGLRLTTARFYSPQGRSLSKRGVTPQISVASSGYRGESLEESLSGDLQLREALRVAQQRLVRP